MTEGYLRENGEMLLIAEAPWIDPNGQKRIGRLAVHTSTLKERVQRQQGFSVAQLYHIVIPGLILTRHIFQGLRRRLYDDDAQDADKSKLVYTRRAAFDYMLARDRATGQLEAVRTAAPTGKTFFVIVSPNERHKAKFPSVDGWIDHWNWTQEDAILSESPINWIDRYDRKLYTSDH